MVFLLAGASNAETTRPNVLFIAVDDLRPELGCYGKRQIHSPHLDRLAATGTLFERAYCMVPTCGASRAALMTGLRPARDRFVNYLTWVEKDAPEVTPLHTHFRNHGYHTVSLGKVLHHRMDCADGWSETPWRPGNGMAYLLPENQKIHRQNANRDGNPRRGPPYEAAPVPDEAYADGALAARAVETLTRLSQQNEPFFLAVGFLKPHLPFNAPQKYWDLYDPNQIHLPDNYHRPDNAPNQAIHSFGELRAYHGVPSRGPVSDAMAHRLIHGYYACVSFTDAQVGKLLDALNRLKIAEKTIVILWGDHGWNLGEHSLWCKHCTFETSMRAPLMIRVPGIPGGQRTRALTEFIDIYPTLCELAGLPLPGHLQGASLVPILRDPSRQGKTAAIGRYRTGDTIRTDHYRFTAYTGNQGELQARMLYDHRSDPGENFNIAESPGQTEIVRNLHERLVRNMGTTTP